MTTANPIPAQQETLEPCPFCGRKAMIEEFRDGDDPQPLFVATCEVCPVKTYDQFTAQEAARVWNARAAAFGPRSLFPQGDWQHVQIKAGNPRVVAIQFETAEQATEFINTFAATSSPTPAESVDKERQRCAAIARAWLWGSITDPGVLESVGRYAAQRCQGILHAILSGADASHLAGAEGRDGLVPPERTREIFDAGFAATSPAERSTWNEVLSEFADTAIKCHIGFKHDGPWDECKWVECEDRRKLIQRANAAAPADNDAREVCRLLSTLDWVVGYELVTENQLILDRAQELALKVMGMTNPPTPTKGDR